MKNAAKWFGIALLLLAGASLSAPPLATCG